MDRSIFEADIVRTGGIVRRSKVDVRTYSSFEELLEQVRERGFHLIETGDQYIVLCNKGAMIIHC